MGDCCAPPRSHDPPRIARDPLDRRTTSLAREARAPRRPRARPGALDRRAGPHRVGEPVREGRGAAVVAADGPVRDVFVVGPYLGLRLLRHHVTASVTRTVLEGVVRVALFLGYLALIGRMKEIRRVFQYHGAEHKTIAAFEHDAPLEPESVDRFSTLHVRCGTNFLLIVMLLAIVVYTLFGNHGIAWGIALRLVTVPVIAGLSYELLRLGARFPHSPVMRALMAPGLWLQKITTRRPDHDQLDVAIASFQELLRREGASQR
ncbi:MAG: DUF1385 domain-containing protein [Actinobacteria bacterium]|nr:MAG: DUF1385 domain-containing protein [Actinomycetota bacterium]